YASLLLDQGDAAECSAAVAIIGAGGIGVDVAHLLSAPPDPRAEFYARYGLRVGAAAAAPTRAAAPRRAVTLMRRAGRIGDGIGPSTRWVALQELEQAGVQLLTGVSYERIEADAVAITTAEGESGRVQADTVVIAAGQEPETALASALSGTAVPTVTIGG